MIRKWTKRKLVRWIKQRAKQRKKINSSYVRDHHGAINRAAYRLYGSWRGAIEAAGIDYKTVNIRGRRENPKWTKESLTKAIMVLHRAGEPLNAYYILHNHGILSAVAYYLYGKGSWEKAITAAGLNYAIIRRKIHKKWTKRLVVQEIKKRRRAGLPLNDWNIPSQLTSPARKLFGSWLKAIHAAGLTYGQIKKTRQLQQGWWTKKRVLMRIRQLEKQGVRLNPNNMHKIQGPLYQAGAKLFGSWHQALSAAGISYRDHYMNWSTKAYLESMSEKEYRSTLKNARSHAKKRGRK